MALVLQVLASAFACPSMPRLGTKAPELASWPWPQRLAHSASEGASPALFSSSLSLSLSLSLFFSEVSEWPEKSLAALRKAAAQLGASEMALLPL